MTLLEELPKILECDRFPLGVELAEPLLQSVSNRRLGFGLWLLSSWLLGNWGSRFLRGFDLLLSILSGLWLLGGLKIFNGVEFAARTAQGGCTRGFSKDDRPNSRLANALNQAREIAVPRHDADCFRVPQAQLLHGIDNEREVSGVLVWSIVQDFDRDDTVFPQDFPFVPKIHSISPAIANIPIPGKPTQDSGHSLKANIVRINEEREFWEMSVH